MKTVPEGAGGERRLTSWHILCDFDGTIATEDVTDSLLARFADPEWRAIEADWKAGLIGSRECMARQVALIRAAPDEIERHLADIEIERHFAGFVRLCQTLDVPLTIVSDGIDYAIRFLLSREGLGHISVISNRLERTSADTYCLRFPYANNSCTAGSGTCKCATRSLHTPPRRALLIGDGASDFCAASEVDLVFAKDALLDHCRKVDAPHVACGNFAEAQSLLAALVGEQAELPAAFAFPRFIEDFPL